MKRQRRLFTPGGKVRILKRHLVDKVPVSTLCDVENRGQENRQENRGQTPIFIIQNSR
jgi:hypothetical protein